MAVVKINNKSTFVVCFQQRELGDGFVEASAVRKNKLIFVNWTLPLLTWSGHDIKCVEDILDMIKRVANWQGKIQNVQPKLGAHAHKPTILRNNGLKDQKIRFPIFAKQSAPFVQWVRNEEEDSQWLVHGYTFNNDLPSAGAYFAALTKLKEEYVAMNRVGSRSK